MPYVIKMFQFEDKPIHAVIIDGKYMFSARDVAVALGYSDPSRAYHTNCKSLRLFSCDKSSDINWVNEIQQFEYLIDESDVNKLIVNKQHVVFNEWFIKVLKFIKNEFNTQ